MSSSRRRGSKMEEIDFYLKRVDVFINICRYLVDLSKEEKVRELETLLLEKRLSLLFLGRDMIAVNSFEDSADSVLDLRNRVRRLEAELEELWNDLLGNIKLYLF